VGRRSWGKIPPLQPYVNQNGLGTLQHNPYGNTSQDFRAKIRAHAIARRRFRQNPYNQAMADYADFYGLAKGMMYQPDIDSIHSRT
jgi:hypothetical protein